jgi:gas vesicle protein
MGETIDALGYKADVPARAKDAVSDRMESLKSKIGGVGSQVAEATPGREEVGQTARQAVGVVQSNPLGLAIGGAAVGFLAGMLIPSTKVENERIGPVADQVKEQARQTGEEALEHGRQIASETAETATEKVKEAAAEITDQAQQSAQEHGEDLAESARHSAEELQHSRG